MSQMKEHRLELDDIFREILGNNHTYFQPPESVKLQYPCIVYDRDIRTVKADDISYLYRCRYEVTLIAKDPDSELPLKILDLPYCSMDRHFTNDNLHHWVFTLYYK